VRASFGAGFSSIYTLLRLRDQLGLSVRIIDAGSDLGDTWHWNTYLGVRVDCLGAIYSFGIEEVWRSWNSSETYPGQKEIQSYIEHVGWILSIRKDGVQLSHKFSMFDSANAKWTIQTDNGKTAVAQHIVPAAGFATKQRIPSWKRLETFEGTIYHVSLWAKEDADVRVSRVAVIGTGSTGVRIIQQWAKRQQNSIS
jgi:cation diffusion facilitator CzcD-associated flavoprotein CzcO